MSEPRKHLALVARQFVATLLISPDPLSQADLTALDAAVAQLDLRVLARPSESDGMSQLDHIVEVRKVVPHRNTSN